MKRKGYALAFMGFWRVQFVSHGLDGDTARRLAATFNAGRRWWQCKLEVVPPSVMAAIMRDTGRFADDLSNAEIEAEEARLLREWQRPPASN